MDWGQWDPCGVTVEVWVMKYLGCLSGIWAVRTLKFQYKCGIWELVAQECYSGLLVVEALVNHKR